jgi:hypothetical protein
MRVSSAKKKARLTLIKIFLKTHKKSNLNFYELQKLVYII